MVMLTDYAVQKRVEMGDEEVKMTKKRYIELIYIANALCVWLQRKGVKSYEACVVREITERLFNLPD